MNDQKVIFGENADLADYVERITSARVYDVARVTSLDRARRLSDRLGANVLLKREDTQEVHSFKIRGAYQKMSGLSAAERAKGVLTASAGNHAQGVALSATGPFPRRSRRTSPGPWTRRSIFE